MSDKQEYLNERFTGTFCQWCRHPERPVLRSGLCNLCNKTRLDIAKQEKLVASGTFKSAVDRQGAEYRLSMLRKKIEVAKQEGARYGDLNHQEGMLGLQLEHELSRISEWAVGKDLYYGQAGFFDRYLSIEEQRFMLFILSDMGRYYMQRHRTQLAWDMHWQEIRQQQDGS